jgi:cytochrome c oxidase subunit 4
MSSARVISVPTYIVVLLVLCVLTVLTVAVSFIPLSPHWHLTAGLAIGAVKASLVVLFFMHAAISPRVTWCVITAAILWLIILFGLALTDFPTRGMIPYMPGH